MRTTAIFNAKGGVGKTITTVNMAAELAARGKRVLVVDADPQCDTSRFFKAEDGCTLYDVLTGCHEPYWPNNVLPTAFERIELLPGDARLTTLDIKAIKDGGVNLTALRDFCDCIAEDDGYDYLLIDCPPSFTAATTAALAAVNDVVIPIKPDSFSIHGMDNMVQQISGMREINPRLRVAGVLLTMMTNCNAAVQGAEAVRKLPVPVYTQMIRRSTKADESTYLCRPMRELLNTKPGYENAATDYRDFVTEYMEGVKNG